MSMQIASTIRQQIMAGDRWCLAACGARDYVSLTPESFDDCVGGLMFRVTISRGLFHKIIVVLTGRDDYRVTLWGGKRTAVKGSEIETVTCYCDDLADVVYSLCNKRSRTV